MRRHTNIRGGGESIEEGVYIVRVAVSGDRGVLGCNYVMNDQKC